MITIKKFVVNKVPLEIVERAVKIIQNKLPKNGRILALSLIGSRALGWADEKSDYDIHGIFAAKNFWDWVHSGEEFDINLFELNYIFTHFPDYLSFEFFQNIANPIYLNPDFDYKGLISFCSPRSCFVNLSEINSLDICFSPKTALHCYRQLLVQINFLKKRQFELNIFKIIKKNYNLEMPERLKELYINEINRIPDIITETEKKKTKKELSILLGEFRKLKIKFKDEKIDNKRFEKWKQKTIKTFYG